MKAHSIAQVIRWLARAGSVASIGLLVAFLVGEGLPPITCQSALFPFGVMVGLLVAWRFERTGGTITVACLLMFYALEYFCGGAFPKGSAFWLISAPGALFLVSGWMRANP